MISDRAYYGTLGFLAGIVFGVLFCIIVVSVSTPPLQRVSENTTVLERSPPKGDLHPISMHEAQPGFSCMRNAGVF